MAAVETEHSLRTKDGVFELSEEAHAELTELDDSALARRLRDAVLETALRRDQTALEVLQDVTDVVSLISEL